MPIRKIGDSAKNYMPRFALQSQKLGMANPGSMQNMSPNGMDLRDHPPKNNRFIDGEAACRMAPDSGSGFELLSLRIP